VKTNTWPIFVRISHWIIAGIIGFNLVNDTGYNHRTLGYIACAIVFIRIVYGLICNKSSAGKLSIPSPTSIKMHILAIKSGHVETFSGHNPLGLLAIYLMWSLIAMLAITGWLSRTDMFWGEDWPVQTHEILSDILLCMISLHIFAVIMMSWLQKKNLIKAMIKG